LICQILTERDEQEEEVGHEIADFQPCS
jgi:hypothetical protein